MLGTRTNFYKIFSQIKKPHFNSAIKQNLIHQGKGHQTLSSLDDRQYFRNINANKQRIKFIDDEILSQTTQHVEKFIQGSGLLIPDIQVSILNHIYQKKPEMLAHIVQNLPPISTLTRELSLIRVFDLLQRQNILTKQNIQQLFTQFLFIVSRQEQIVDVKNQQSLLGFLRKLVESHNGLPLDQISLFLKQLVQKQQDHLQLQFVFQVLDIFKSKKLDFSKLSLLTNDQIVSMLLIPYTGETFFISERLEQLKKFDLVQRFYFFSKLHKQQISDQNAQILLDQLEGNALYLQLVTHIDKIQIDQNKINQEINKTKRLNAIHLYNVLILRNAKNIPIKGQFDIQLLLKDIKLLIYVLNQATDHCDRLMQDHDFQNSFMSVFSRATDLDQEDIQRSLFMLQKTQLPQYQFDKIAPSIVRVLDKCLKNGLSLNKSCSFLYSLCYLKKTFGIELNTQIAQLQEKVLNHYSQLSPQKIFLVYKATQICQDLTLLDKEVKQSFNQGKMDEELPALINFTTNQIKQQQFIYSELKNLDRIIDLLVKNPQSNNLDVVQELSYLIIQLEKCGGNKNIIKELHKTNIGSLTYIPLKRRFPIYLSQLHYQNKPDISFENLHSLRNSELIQLYQLVLQKEQQDEILHDVRAQLRLNEIFKGNSTRDADQGLSTLLFYTVSLDQDRQFQYQLIEGFQNEIENIVVSIKNQDLIQTESNINTKSNQELRLIQSLQLYQGATFYKHFGIEHSLIDQILNDQSLKKIIQGSSKEFVDTAFETEVRQVLQEKYPNLTLHQEYSEIIPFKLDFYLQEKQMAIECDGYHHYVCGKLKKSQKIRKEILKKHQIEVRSIFVQEWKKASKIERLAMLQLF